MNYINAQTDENPDSAFYRTYSCYNTLDSIWLSAKFHGPKYYNYHEGSIIYFWTNDTCSVQILCGGNAELVLDSSYKTLDLNNEDYYYSEILKRYARIALIRNRLIQYEMAKPEQKEELDKILDHMKRVDSSLNKN